MSAEKQNIYPKTFFVTIFLARAIIEDSRAQFFLEN
jgi:hypothetical protein